MKSKTLLFGFNIVIVFLLAIQVTNATQDIQPETIVANETPLTLMEKIRNRFLNQTENHEWLFNQTRECDCQCNNTNDNDCDCDQLRLRDRIQERIQECIQDCEDGLMQMIQNVFRHKG